ncbi:37S ribosomal protein rsm22 [Apiospora kogelbergensis]|uniref:37S ribosomal protein rsm22 n=1 Tax=Apiospora kogelbergensis TaxID=1337665 RepID=A0AAW0RAL1_9PEZI
MSVEIWPAIAPDQLKVEEDATQARELTWLLDAIHDTLRTLKSSLEETYALLAPIDPGATLVVSTPKHETVKGYVTRVGTRLVKGSVALKLRTQPALTLHLDPARPIHIPELTTLNTLLTQSVDILTFVVSESFARGPGHADPRFVSSQLRLLAEYLAEASSLLKGPELPIADQNTPFLRHAAALRPVVLDDVLLLDVLPPDTTWTHSSVPPACFAPPLNPAHLSVHLTIQDASLVLYLRALEPADAPVNFGTKLALAIGTARRLEHDEADRIFGYCPEGADDPIATEGSVLQRTRSGVGASAGARGGGMGKGRGTETQVYVREKVRVVSADPSLLSLSSKLGALGNALALARRNLAIVMGETDEGGE